MSAGEERMILLHVWDTGPNEEEQLQSLENHWGKREAYSPQVVTDE